MWEGCGGGARGATSWAAVCAGEPGARTRAARRARAHAAPGMRQGEEGMRVGAGDGGGFGGDLNGEHCMTLVRLGIDVRAREETALVEGTGV